jgi:hypothetical protein
MIVLRVPAGVASPTPQGGKMEQLTPLQGLFIAVIIVVLAALFYSITGIFRERE